MPERTLDDLRSHLRSWAEELNARVSEPPVLVRDICSSLGVFIEKKDTVPQYKAYLSVDPFKDHSALILLPSKEIGNFERFCIAHELAHYLLLVLFSALPQNKSEYWKHEELCDDFARCLLVPTRYVSQRLHDENASATRYLHLCGEISQSARVPWIQVAHRIAELRPNVTYLRCQRLPSNAFKLVATTHPRRKGRGTLVKKDTKLWTAFNELLGRSQETTRVIRSDMTKLFVECDVADALGLTRGASVMAEAQTRGFDDIRIAARATA